MRHYYPHFIFTATADSDYTTTSDDFTFTSSSASGSTLCLTVSIGDDSFVENDETFIVILTLMSTGVELGQTTVTIQDDEGIFLISPNVLLTAHLPELSLSVEPTATVEENVAGLMVQVCATLATSPTAATTAIAVSIVLSTVDGTGR